MIWNEIQIKPYLKLKKGIERGVFYAAE